MRTVRTTLRVRYEETDRMAVAYYANYFVWFEVGRTEYLRNIGIPYRVMEEKYHCILPVTEAFCKYRRSVEYDDEVIVETAVKDLKRKGIIFCLQAL